MGDWNAKVGSQGKPGVTGKFGLGVQNEVGQTLTDLKLPVAQIMNSLLPNSDLN